MTAAVLVQERLRAVLHRNACRNSGARKPVLAAHDQVTHKYKKNKFFLILLRLGNAKMLKTQYIIGIVVAIFCVVAR